MCLRSNQGRAKNKRSLVIRVVQNRVLLACDEKCSPNMIAWDYCNLKPADLILKAQPTIPLAHALMRPAKLPKLKSAKVNEAEAHKAMLADLREERHH